MSYKGGGASGSGKGKRERGPTVLVTDSRDPAYNPGRGDNQNNASSRFITVDNILQYTSDVPSMQQRQPPPGFRPRPRSRSGVLASAGASTDLGGSSGMDPRLRAVGRLAAMPHLPPRSTKVSEKLVLLPETVAEEGEPGEEEDEEGGYEGFDGSVDEELGPRIPAPAVERARRFSAGKQQRFHTALGDFDQDNEASPLLAEEERLKRRRVPPEKAKSYAERLPKAHRGKKLPRVTAYCTAQGYKISSTAAFVKEYHGARTKLYDDCLYTAYHLPLLPGKGGYRIRSSPILKSAGGKAVLDEEIERNEQRDYHDEYYTEEDEHSVKAHGFDGAGSEERTAQGEGDGEGRAETNGVTAHEEQGRHNRADKDRNTHNLPATISVARIPPNALTFAEMFIFSYGVVVFWNFTEREEKDVLADLAFASSERGGAPIPLATAPLPEEDFETEEFHFEYSDKISRPRVYNDMITLRSGDHMIKLAISHGIAQSTKLSFFEEVMARQMAEAKDVPRRLALTGHLGMKREEVFRILGKLFRSRVEVNLSSNMLDVPSFFWDSEPTLHPLYIGVREYLEIKPRIQVLNERCRVFLDLAEILSDSIADSQMSRQTWIIIILIAISIIVTISEVILRFGMLSTRSSTTAQPSQMVHQAYGYGPARLS
ncbi:hypothetical protein GX51_05010 [Blastomyces parvus]|uniref:DUF155 domain-containing protein n=1 Tax=Blastomyces parvus TaxID=2060905 RepID=A0A2B7WZ05_9EURO|nr:hypothetical protein GX51_05010 [Blastomyces parvus]